MEPQCSRCCWSAAQRVRGTGGRLPYTAGCATRQLVGQPLVPAYRLCAAPCLGSTGGLALLGHLPPPASSIRAQGGIFLSCFLVPSLATNQRTAPTRSM